LNCHGERQEGKIRRSYDKKESKNFTGVALRTSKKEEGVYLPLQKSKKEKGSTPLLGSN